jgi:6-phosphogluconolactonase
MIQRLVPGQLVTEKDAAGVAREAATRIAAAVKNAVSATGRASLALSGGNTPRGAYALLAQSGVDWTKTQIFWVDERAVAPTDDRSNYRWAKATLLDPARIPSAQVHRMPADAADLDAAARAYEKTIAELVEPDAGGVPAFDVVVLGVGDDGHTASLFPGETTVDIVDRLVATAPPRPGREARLTLTRRAIEHARNVFVLAEGAGKKNALNRAWADEGDVHETPSRIVRECKGAVTWIVDETAASAQTDTKV